MRNSSLFANHVYEHLPETVPVTVTVTRCVKDPFVKSTLIGELIEPVVALKVTVFGMTPAEGLTVKPVPGEISPGPNAKVLNVPLPVTETLPELPHAIVSVVGATVNEAVVTASPCGPFTAVNEAVSTVRPLASVTINETVPHPVTCAVNLPPLVLTVLGLTVATLASGDLALYGGVPPKM